MKILFANLFSVLRRAEKVTVFHEAIVVSRELPSPSQYNFDPILHKRRASANVFATSKTSRLEPLARNDSTDFYETAEAVKKIKIKSPSAQFF